MDCVMVMLRLIIVDNVLIHNSSIVNWTALACVVVSSDQTLVVSVSYLKKVLLLITLTVMVTAGEQQLWMPVEYVTLVILDYLLTQQWTHVEYVTGTIPLAMDAMVS